MENSNSELPKRKNIRLPNFDYRSGMNYFLTICTYERQKLFGSIRHGIVYTNDMGMRIIELLYETDAHYSGILHLNTFAVMPDHLHLLVTLDKDESSISIPEYVKQIKTYLQHKIIQDINSESFAPFQKKMWQRNYYEHIVRDEVEYYQIFHYIRENPRKDFDERLINGEYVSIPGELEIINQNKFE